MSEIIIKHHKDLDVWKESMALVNMIYQATKFFPKDELFTLTSQMRRAAISIPSNIAEGAARGSTKEFIHFINISLGSLAELDTQIEIGLMQGYITNYTDLQLSTTKVRNYLTALKKSLITNL